MRRLRGLWAVVGTAGHRRVGRHLRKDWAAPAKNRALSGGRLTRPSPSVSHQGYLALLSIERVIAPSLHIWGITILCLLVNSDCDPGLEPAFRPYPSSCVDMILPSNHPPCPGLAQCNSCMA